MAAVVGAIGDDPTLHDVFLSAKSLEFFDKSATNSLLTVVGRYGDFVEADHALRAINAVEEIGDEESGGRAVVVGHEEDIVAVREELCEVRGSGGAHGLLELI